MSVLQHTCYLWPIYLSILIELPRIVYISGVLPLLETPTHRCLHYNNHLLTIIFLGI